MMQDMKRLTQGKRNVLWTDSKKVYIRLSKKKICSKKFLHLRVSRLLALVWENYLEEIFEIRFLLGEHNEGADVLSRWGLRDSGVDVDDTDRPKN